MSLANLIMWARDRVDAAARPARRGCGKGIREAVRYKALVRTMQKALLLQDPTDQHLALKACKEQAEGWELRAAEWTVKSGEQYRVKLSPGDAEVVVVHGDKETLGLLKTTVVALALHPELYRDITLLHTTRLDYFAPTGSGGGGSGPDPLWTMSIGDKSDRLLWLKWVTVKGAGDAAEFTFHQRDGSGAALHLHTFAHSPNDMLREERKSRFGTKKSAVEAFNEQFEDFEFEIARHMLDVYPWDEQKLQRMARQPHKHPSIVFLDSNWGQYVVGCAQLQSFFEE